MKLNKVHHSPVMAAIAIKTEGVHALAHPHWALYYIRWPEYVTLYERRMENYTCRLRRWLQQIAAFVAKHTVSLTMTPSRTFAHTCIQNQLANGSRHFERGCIFCRKCFPRLNEIVFLCVCGHHLFWALCTHTTLDRFCCALCMYTGK
jgi:hypothetical protein